MMHRCEQHTITVFERALAGHGVLATVDVSAAARASRPRAAPQPQICVQGSDIGSANQQEGALIVVKRIVSLHLLSTRHLSRKLFLKYSARCICSSLAR